jgi:hypothetical protein
LWIWRDVTRDNKGTGLVLSRIQIISLKFALEANIFLTTDCTDSTDKEGLGADSATTCAMDLVSLDWMAGMTKKSSVVSGLCTHTMPDHPASPCGEVDA